MSKYIFQLRRGTKKQWEDYEDSKYIIADKYYATTTYYTDKQGTIANPRPTNQTELDSKTYYMDNPEYLAPLEGELVLEYDDVYDENGILIKRIPRLKIGDGLTDYSGLAYISSDSFVLPTPNTITLYATKWTQLSEKEYVQDVTDQLKGLVSPHSKVDLQPTPEQLCVFHHKDVAFTTVNEDDNKIKVYAVGIQPSSDYTIQVTITEVDGTWLE